MRASRLLTLLLGVVLPAGAGDLDIHRRIEERIEKAKLDEGGQITVSVEEGRATLSGSVTTVSARQKAEKAALKETKLVENLLRVLPEARSDDEVRKAVRDTILRTPFYTVFDSVSMGVEGGAVLLSGSVSSPDRRKDIEERVARVVGVREIRNDVRVQPTSVFDDRLRRQLYGAIYGSDQFFPYAAWPNPPIRIIVERGKVTLTGVVASPVEQALLGHIARGIPSFGVDNQVKVEGEEREEPVKKPKNG